jgi:phosphoribosylglycinamide formyltransferase-1
VINVEIWASGSGTNADVICAYFKDNQEISITNIGCNRKEAGVFDVAKRHYIPTTYFSKEDWTAQNILNQLKERNIDYIVLAGFLKLVPKEIIETFAGRIVNIHPSLLPKYGGKNMYGEHVHNAVLANNEQYTGITIHDVNEEFDTGKVLAQYTTALAAIDNLSIVKKKIQVLEHTHFAPTIEAWILANG